MTCIASDLPRPLHVTRKGSDLTLRPGKLSRPFAEDRA